MNDRGDARAIAEAKVKPGLGLAQLREVKVSEVEGSKGQGSQEGAATPLSDIGNQASATACGIADARQMPSKSYSKRSEVKRSEGKWREAEKAPPARSHAASILAAATSTLAPAKIR